MLCHNSIQTIIAAYTVFFLVYNKDKFKIDTMELRPQ